MQFQDNYPLKNVTTLCIGGPAKKFVAVRTEQELKEAIKFVKKFPMPYLVIGGGSNLLVADEGINCLVIKNEITGIEQISHLGGVILKVKSGTPLQELVSFSINSGLAGLEKLSGIPGTVGGAIYGNAGAYGQAISDYLTEVSTIETLGIKKEQCQFNYRESIFKKNHSIILEASFQLEKGNPKQLMESAKEVLAKRSIKYPPGIKCPGSFFKNLVALTIPPKILKNIPAQKIVYGKLPAGALLEEVGAKGQKLDGIEIASYHANLFINNGGDATTFYNLAKKYATLVKDRFGISLEPEVQLINLPPFSV